MTRVLGQYGSRPTGASYLLHRTKHCWACGFDWSQLGTRIPRELAVLLYELAVEEIEAWLGDFRTVDIWQRVRDRATRELRQLAEAGRPSWGGWYWSGMAHTYTKYAVTDLYLHGLIRCTRIDRTGRRCLLWEIATPPIMGRDRDAQDPTAPGCPPTIEGCDTPGEARAAILRLASEGRYLRVRSQP